MLKKALRRAAAVLIAVYAVTAAPVVKTSAANAEWDGKTELLPGNTYTVTKEISVKNDFTVPANSRIVVMDGGKLKFPLNRNVVVSGELSVAQGGEIRQSGTVSVRKSGSIGVYGSYVSTTSSSLNIAGKITVYNRGNLKISGVFKLYSGAAMLNKRAVTLTGNSMASVSGKITCNKKTEFTVSGMFSLTVSGGITSSGSMTITKNGQFKNSGYVLLERGAKFKNSGIFKNTRKGVFIDRTDGTDYDSMTAEAIAKQPEVDLIGIDVSVWNGDIDWAAVSESGIDFVMIRAGRGHVSDDKPMTVDAKFEYNITQANEYGIEAGVYFYSYADSVREIEEEARFLVGLLKGHRITYPVALDVEEKNIGSKTKTTEMVDAFFKIIMDAGYFPMLYSYKSWFEDNLDDRTLGKYSIWVAELKESPTYTGTYYIWQFSHTGRVPGIEGDVDMNIAYRDFAAIIKSKKFNNL